MKVKDFLKMINIENQNINIIIPLNDTYILRNPAEMDLGNEEISDTEQVIFCSDSCPIRDRNTYEQFGIEPCFISKYKDSSNYEVVDVKESDDHYFFVYNEEGKVWLIIDDI